MKGFLGGVSVGAIVAVAGAAMWSLSAPLPSRIEVDTTTSDQSQQPEVAEAEAPETVERRDADLVEAAPQSPSGSGAADTSPIAVLDTDPGAPPVVATAEGASKGDMSQGRRVETLPQVPSSVQAETARADAPDVPGQEDSPVVSTETAEVPTPPRDAESTVNPTMQTSELATEEGGTAEAAPQPDSGLAAEVARPAAPSLSGPVIGSAPTATVLPSIAANPVARPQIGAEVPPTDQAPSTDQVTGTDALSEQSEEEPAELELTDLELAEDEPRADAGSSASGARLGTRVVPLTERSSSPSLVGSDDATSAVEVSPAEDQGRPFEQNAETFAAPTDRPLMSIVLIDDAGAVGAEALEGFPYPLTFAISPGDPEAREKMQARRAAGFEVLILADLPREATPQDAETAMAVWMEQLPQAVGVLEGVDSGFQGNRPLADQMVTVMQSAGYGMVTQNSGLNTVQKLALRDGMPAGVVFRDFDGAGQNPRAIRRFLDQAAFRARQEGAVIMLGRLRPETISALLLWGLQDRASQVGLAPISAGLKATLPPQE